MQFIESTKKDGRPGRALIRRVALFLMLLVAPLILAAEAHAGDWVVNVTDNPDPVPAGGTVEYAITAERTNGNGPASLFLQIPDGTQFTGLDSATITDCQPGNVQGPAVVTCSIPSTPLNLQRSAVAKLKTLKDGVITFRAAAGDALPDPWDGNSTPQTTTVTPGADLELELTGPDTDPAGSTGAYIFTVSNKGPNDAVEYKLTVPTAAGFAITKTPDGCTFVAPANSYVCTITTPLSPGATATYTFEGQFTAAGGSTVTVLGSVEAVRPLDPNTDLNTRSKSTVLTTGSDLALTKVRSPTKSPLLVGDKVTFTLTPSYAGDDPQNVYVEDTLPDNYDLVDPTPEGDGWTCTVTAPRSVRCERPSGLGTGQQTLPAITINAEAARPTVPPALAKNVATAGSDTPDPNSLNNRADDGGVAIEQAKVLLKANKSGPRPAIVTVGGEYSFFISTTNRGNDSFTGAVTMTDPVPAGLQFVRFGATNQWTCTPPGTEVSCTREYTDASPLGPGAATPFVEVVFRVRDDVSPLPPTLSNCMTVTTTGQNDTICYGVSPKPLDASANLVVTKTIVSPSPASVASGQPITFSIKVANQPIAGVAPTVATSITMRDVLRQLINNNDIGPGVGVEAVSFVEGDAQGMTCGLTSEMPADGRTRALECKIQQLPICDDGVKTCPVITVTMRPGGNPSNNRVNTANAFSSTVADPDHSDNTRSVTYNVTPGFELDVNKTASPVVPRAGENLTYGIAVTNKAGASDATSVRIEDPLPANVTFVSASPECSYGSASNLVTCNVGRLNSGVQTTVTIVVSPIYVPRPGTPNTSVTNIAEAIGNNGSFEARASGDVTSNVASPALTLVVNKSDSAPWGPDPVLFGGTVVYGITVTNTGPSAATGVEIVDTLPVDFLSYVSNTAPSDVTCNAATRAPQPGGTLTCTMARLPPGESRTLAVSMLAGNAVGDPENAVSVTSSETRDGIGTGGSVTEKTRVVAPVDLQITKTAEQSNLSSREFGYLIQVRNIAVPGQPKVHDAELVRVVDTLQKDLVLSGTPVASKGGIDPPSGTCTGTAGATDFRCELGTVTETETVEIRVPVRATAVSLENQPFTNVAIVSTESQNQRDDNDTNDRAEATAYVRSVLLTGTVFIDYDQQGDQTLPQDIGVNGVPIQLTGTSGSASVSETVTTATVNGRDGFYSFFVAPGTYSVTRGQPPAGLSPGASFVGTTDGQSNGTSNGPSQVSGVVIADTTQLASGYDFSLFAARGVTLQKDVVSGPTVDADGNFNTSFRLTLTNTSAEPLDSLTVTDVLEGPPPRFGAYAAPPSSEGSYDVPSPPQGSCPGLNGQFKGTEGSTVLAQGFSLSPGASCTLEFRLRQNPHNPLPPEANGGRYQNTATTTGTGQFSGVAVTAEASAAISPAAPRLGIAKVLEGYQDNDNSGTVTLDDVLTYKVTATNTGSVPLSAVVVSDNRITPSDTTCPVLQPDETCVLTGTYAVTIADVQAGQVTNTATADSNETGPVTATVTTPVVPVFDKNTLTKTALVNTAKRGEKVPYVIVAQQVPFNPARIIDVMPPAFAFVAGSARANGQKVVPAIDGRRLTFDGLVPDAKGGIKLELVLVATAAVNPGTAVNQAQLVSPVTGQVVATARARVTILAEAVFDCGDVIGKVFDDQNRNGYQDEGEPGLPAVRVATVHGLLITTDADGRFNIPCADIPDADIGSNFIVKLDTRTLPTGYHVTTENPRRVRLTRGKVVKLNFGASISRLVKLELNGRVFAAGSAALNPKWQAGLDRLVATLEAETSVLVITYRGDEDPLARARLSAVRDAVNQRWRAVSGRYELAIDTRIISGGGQ